MRRRPPLRRLGAVACAALLLLAGGCSSTVDIDAPPLSGDDARACRALVADLPERVADQPVRDADAGQGFGAAWGDPAIVLRCGVPMPSSFDKFATCQVTNGVGWYIPESQIRNEPVDIVMTTVGRAQNVQVSIPQDYFPPATAMVDLAQAVTDSIAEEKPCV